MIKTFVAHSTGSEYSKAISNLGVVLSIGDGIARVAGLPNIKAGEMVYIFGAKKKS